MHINTEETSKKYRDLTVDISNKSVLLTNFLDSGQEKELTVPPNCKGFGRIRHFRRKTSDRWPQNALPIDPAAKALSLSTKLEELKAQVFQTASCNWRCWYCYVPYKLLSANKKYSEFLTVSEIVDLYLDNGDRPKVIDLSGGQPELVPEFVLWVMEELIKRDLKNEVYLWSDDNLSNDYFWRYLSEKDIELVVNYKNYGRVGCFKGFDEDSFSFNTRANPELFNQQFNLMKRYIDTGLDMYAYVTLTSNNKSNITDKVKCFIDRMQQIDENLPLRTVPLEIQVFYPVAPRLKEEHEIGLEVQNEAIEVWKNELINRFPSSLLNKNIANIPLSFSKVGKD